MRKILGGDLGVADLPMLLMVSAIVTAISIPVFWSAYEDVSGQMVIGDVLECADRIFTCSSLVLNGGEGSSMEIDVDLTGSGSISVEDFIVGGPVAGESSHWSLLVHFTLSNSETGHLTHSPPIRMSNSTGTGQLVLHGGEYELRITHRMISDLHYASIELV